jgi:DUF1365 family protein
VESCIYEGRVKHTRTEPVLHRFSYRVFMMYLDLDELPTLFRKRWLWSASRPALARFRREDHLGAPKEPLSESVRSLVERETGSRPAGPIRVLTNLSYFGYCFNPVSFYYCFDEDGETLQTILAEVNNTPWGERDTYVLPESMDIGRRGVMRFQPEKKMHVSPFMPMDVEYDWCFTEPAGQISVYMANSNAGKRIFDASFKLKRKEITGRSLAGILVRFPLMTVKIISGIYWQALRLWLKRCPLYPHPDKRQKIAAEAQ